MSRAEAFHAFYDRTHARLLHETYALTGDVEAAQQGVAEAYVLASAHWRKVSQLSSPDAWLRARAARVASRLARRAQRGTSTGAQRAAKERAAGEPTENDRLLAGLADLDGDVRRLVVLRHLVELDVSAAAREAGVTDAAAADMLASASATLEAHHVDPDPTALREALHGLSVDLADVPAGRPRPLRREGARRRRSHVVLAALCSVAVLIVAGALTVGRDPGHAAAPPPTPTPTTPSEPASPDPRLTPADMLSLHQVSRLDDSQHWQSTGTSADGAGRDHFAPCVQRLPVDAKSAHFWSRGFRSGKDHPIRVRQTLEVSAGQQQATRNFHRLVDSFSICAGHQVTAFTRATLIGDRARLLTLRHPTRRGVHTEHLAIGQSGNTVTLVEVRAPHASQVSPRALVRLLGVAVDEVCSVNFGGCAFTPYQLTKARPPRVGTPRGFLSVVDLPVFRGLARPWAATDPKAVKQNPSATACDRANFAGGGAARVRARSYVIPHAKLPTVFGLTETVGEFSNAKRARRFVRSVSAAVRSCHDRQLSLALHGTQQLHLDRGRGLVWRIRVAASQHQGQTFKVALVQVGKRVAEVTFTPAKHATVRHRDFIALAERTAGRLSE
ncbi:MAG: hypothetical protein ACRDQA_06490 [Nocardioidaceae bacterium]